MYVVDAKKVREEFEFIKFLTKDLSESFHEIMDKSLANIMRTEFFTESYRARSERP